MLQTPSENRKFQFADLAIDTASGEVWRDEEQISLPKLSFKLLLVLAENSPNTLQQSELIEQIWPDTVVGDETLKQRVKLLRKSLGDNALSPVYVGAIRGRGYRLLPEVKILISSPPPRPEYEYVFNERVPNLSSAEGMRIWKKMSFALMLLILGLISALYLLSGQLERSKQHDLKSLAILPFVNVTRSNQDDYLVRGMTRELIDVMTDLEELTVVPMHLVENYSDSKRLVSEVAGRFNVGSILDGALTRRNDKLYFDFKLVNSNTSSTLWQAKYHFESNDLLGIQRQVITQVTSHLKANLSQSKRLDALVLTQPNNLTKAYDIYLRGLDYYYRYHYDDNLIAIKLFKQALVIAPNFGLAHAGLADAYSQAVFQFGRDDNWRDFSFISAKKAVELEPKSEVAHKALALAQYLSGDIQLAIQTNLIAIKLKPRYVRATTNQSFFYRESGNLQEALKWGLRTLEIDSSFAPGHLHLAQTYALLGNDNKAERHFERSLSLKPDYLLAKKYYSTYLVLNNQRLRGLEVLDIANGKAKQTLVLIENAGDLELLSENSEQAETYFLRTSELSYPLENTRLNLKLAICEYQIRKSDYLLRELFNTKSYTLFTKRKNTQDLLLVAMAQNLIGNDYLAEQYLQKALTLGFVDDDYLKAHPLLKELRIEKTLQVAKSSQPYKSDLPYIR